MAWDVKNRVAPARSSTTSSRKREELSTLYARSMYTPHLRQKEEEFVTMLETLH
jgi:hypothetical protein